MPFPDFDIADHYVIKRDRIIMVDQEIFRSYYPWRGTHYYAITGRGCPYSCKYCCNIYRGCFERKSVDYFCEELKYIRDKIPFFQTLSIQDDSLFVGKLSWITDFSEKYRTSFNWPLRAALMPRLATLEKIQPLSEAGLTYVGIGLQGSTRLNREIYGRAETSESFLEAVDRCKKFGITCRVDVIIDNPYEREKDLLEIANTLNLVPKPFPISVFTLTLFPGTKMTEKANKDGMAKLFGSDCYRPGLSLYRKEGCYTTPKYWRELYDAYLPNVPKSLCRYLIEHIGSPNVRRKVVRFSPLVKKVRVIGKKLREIAPRHFDKSLKFYKRTTN